MAGGRFSTRPGAEEAATDLPVGDCGRVRERRHYPGRGRERGWRPRSHLRSGRPRTRVLRFCEGPSERIADRRILLSFEDPLSGGRGHPGSEDRRPAPAAGDRGPRQNARCLPTREPGSDQRRSRPAGRRHPPRPDLRQEPGLRAIKEPLGLGARADFERLPKETRGLGELPLFEEGPAATDEIRCPGRVESFAFQPDDLGPQLSILATASGFSGSTARPLPSASIASGSRPCRSRISASRRLSRTICAIRSPSASAAR